MSSSTMSVMPDHTTPDEILAHYGDHLPESDRLLQGQGLLELARTKEVVARHLPAGPLRILDVGGATGIYSDWLAGQGHSVHLVDPVPLHVDQARARAGAPPTFTAEVGDARHLASPDASFDVVLLLGPLYHLVDREERVRALAEARRVLAPGGLVFGGAISRFASLFDGLAHEYLFDPTFRSIVEGDLSDGRHHNPTDRPEWFTTAFFHHPAGLRQEAEDAGLSVREVVGLEGLAGWMPYPDQRWGDPAARETLLFAARATETEPTLLGLSAHLLLVAERPLER